MLPQAVRKIQGIVDLPLCIDTAKAEALKKAADGEKKGPDSEK